MAESSRELLEMILRDCAAAADKPWYPSEYAQATGVDRSRLDAALDELRLGELVRLTEWVQGKGQGYALTEAGREVVQSQRLLAQLRHRGVPARPVRPTAPVNARAAPESDDWDRGKSLRDALMTPSRPLFTQILIALNVANFFVGLLLAVQAGAPYGDYLAFGTNNAKIHEARYLTGAMLGRASLLQGEWWRLVTYCFVHSGGVLHLLMNMWALWVLGPPLERAFGHVRYLWLYLLSGVGGGLAAVYFNPFIGLAGASGAICGLLGAMLAWVWLNRAYLRNSSAMMRSMLMNVFLIALISTMPEVSASGHFGGGIVGLALAIPLNVNRFGTREQRWLGLGGAIAVTALVVGFGYYESVPHSSREAARLTFAAKLDHMNQLTFATRDEYVTPFLKELDKDGKVREVQKKETFEAIDEFIPKLTAFEAELAKAQTFNDSSVNAALVIAEDYFKTWRLYFQSVKGLVNAQGSFIPGSDQRLNSLEESIVKLQKELKSSALAQR